MKSFALATMVAAALAAPIVDMLPANLSMRAVGGVNDVPFGDKKGLAFESYEPAVAQAMSMSGSATWAYNWYAVWSAPAFNYIPMLVSFDDDVE